MRKKDIYVSRRESVSLTFKCVFYRPERNAKSLAVVNVYEDLQMQKWNVPMDRAQRVDERNGVICLVFTVTIEVILKC